MEVELGVGALMPTVGRTIHWQTAGHDECVIVQVVSLEYGPHVDSPAILGREYGDDAHAVRMPLSAGTWHYVHDHDAWKQTASPA